MGRVVVDCPRTGLEFFTGVETDEASFHLLPNVQAHSRCPHCGLEHAWSKREARMESDSGNSHVNGQPRPLSPK